MSSEQLGDIAQGAANASGGGLLAGALYGMDLLYGIVACAFVVLTYCTNKFYRKRQDKRDRRRMEMEEETHEKLMSQK